MVGEGHGAILEDRKYAIPLSVTLEFCKLSESELIQQTQPTQFGINSEGM